jgi:alcohol dehydrogenase, propanol-preferring
MRSLQLTAFGEPLAWSEQPTPTPRGEEVLLETVACGVCHSDLHLWEGYYDLGGGKRSYVRDRGVTLPLTMGHEVVGRVAAVGPDARGVDVGDVRLVFPWIACGDCAHCADDRSNHCTRMRSIGVLTHGGYADHVLVPSARYLVDIGGLPPETACSYACAGLSAYSALKKTLPLSADDDLVIVGAGGLGLMAVQMVRELTSARVTVIDVSDAKLAAARAFGDWTTINSRGTSAVDQVMDASGGRGVAAVIDFVGTAETSGLGFSLLAKNGTLVIVGLFGGELTVPIPSIALKNLTIRGSYTGSLTELRELVEIARRGTLRPLPVTCHPIGEAGDILRRIRDGQVVGRAVLRPELG